MSNFISAFPDVPGIANAKNLQEAIQAVAPTAAQQRNLQLTKGMKIKIGLNRTELVEGDASNFVLLPSSVLF